MILTEEILNNFISKINHAYQQFSVWLYINNEYAKYQKKWNEINGPGIYFSFPSEFSKTTGCKYKNFWGVIIPSLQHSWFLSLIKLFDTPYHPKDNKKTKPRLSLGYILELLEDITLAESIKNKIKKHDNLIKSLKKQRDNCLAHNDVNFTDKKVEAGVENLFEELDEIILDIKKNKLYLKNCNSINMKYTNELSKCGVDEIFEDLTKL